MSAPVPNTGRPEDAVACPACAKAPGDSCDGPTSHPIRKLALESAHRGRFEREIAAAGDGRPRPPFAAPVIRRHVPGIGAPGAHRPTLTRTLNEGPGNATRVCGCSCGAVPTSAEMFADHVGVPVAVVHSLLKLAGLAYDLIDHHDHPKLRREIVAERIADYLEFRT